VNSAYSCTAASNAWDACRCSRCLSVCHAALIGSGMCNICRVCGVISVLATFAKSFGLCFAELLTQLRMLWLFSLLAHEENHRPLLYVEWDRQFCSLAQMLLMNLWLTLVMYLRFHAGGTRAWKEHDKILHLCHKEYTGGQRDSDAVQLRLSQMVCTVHARMGFIIDTFSMSSNSRPRWVAFRK